MKNNILVILVLLLVSSCDNFLEEVPKDRIIPQSVKEYEELLYGEAYMKSTDRVADYLDLLTDDVTSSASRYTFGRDSRESGYGYYAWQQDPEMAMSGGRNYDNAWEKYYHSILICNTALKDLPDSNGDLVDIEDIMAEAYFLRAWDYFMLVNLYGEPYNESTATTSLGVPLNDLIGMEDKLFTRSSVAEVYEQIEKDLESSIDLFLSSNKIKDSFRANITAAYLLTSRVALYKKEFEKAIKYANLALAEKSTLYDLKSKISEGRFINYKNPEIIFSYGAYSNLYYSESRYARSRFPVSEDLGNMFTTNDLRVSRFFDENMPSKSERTTKTGVFAFAMRTAELYLNRAEAYAEIGEIGKAMKDINKLREFRFSSDDYMLLASSKEEAIKIIREERRRELCFERHRWFDLRRWGRPSITHVFVRDKKNDVIETYVLQKDDPAYTLPLPYKVTALNKNIRNIQRPVRTPKN